MGTKPAHQTFVTAPRRVLPGTTYLITRRCSERRFFLRPSRTSNDVFLYLLAVAAQRAGVHVHAYCVLSNHFHMVVTDPDARLPEFKQYLNGLLARALNALIGHWDSFWDSRSFSAVPLETAEDIVAKCGYVLANPVAAGLVRHGRDWPGLWSEPQRFGDGALVIERPKHFFDPNGTMPASASIRLTVPRQFGSAEHFRAAVTTELADRERNAIKENGGSFLGVARVLAQKPTARPKPGEPRRGLNPRVAGRDKWKRIEAIGRLVAFLESYRDAWEAWRANDPNVLFPAGTYHMRVIHDAPCAAFS